MVATLEDPADPIVIQMPKTRGAELTSSYEEEKAALLVALDWARTNGPTERLTIWSDSRYEATIHLIRHCEGPHPTHNYRTSVQ